MEYVYKARDYHKYFSFEGYENEKNIIKLVVATEDTLNFSAILLEKIRINKSEMNKVNDQPDSFERNKPFLEHFSYQEMFINQLRKFYRYAHRLGALLKNRTLSNELLKQKDFKDLVKAIRDSYEHYDEKLLKEDSFVSTSTYRIDNAMNFGNEKFHFNTSSLMLPLKLYDIIIEALEEHVTDRKEKIDAFWQMSREIYIKSLEFELDE